MVTKLSSEEQWVRDGYELAPPTGAPRSYSTGARRDTRDGKGRFDLISPIMLARLARLLEEGAKRYGSRNWEKGIPPTRFLDSAFRHLVKVLAGQDDEDHAVQVIFNMMGYLHTVETRTWASELERSELPPILPQGTLQCIYPKQETRP